MTKTTAQDGSGSTIVPADDLRFDRFGHAHVLTRPIAAPEEAVDAAGPVDAQTRPPRLGKRGPFSTAPTAILVFLIRWKNGEISLTASDRPATITEPRCGRQRAPFADPSPAEIVVADRQ